MFARCSAPVPAVRSDDDVSSRAPESRTHYYRRAQLMVTYPRGRRSRDCAVLPL
jgi:hypothetical protein